MLMAKPAAGARIYYWTGLLLIFGAAACGTLSEPWPPLELARRLGCFACHALGGQGGDRAGPLDGAGQKFSAAEIEMLLQFPRRFHPGAKMPSYAYLPVHERQALAGFLAALKMEAPGNKP